MSTFNQEVHEGVVGTHSSEYLKERATMKINPDIKVGTSSFGDYIILPEELITGGLIIVSVNGGSYKQYTPKGVLLPHQLYVDDLEEMFQVERISSVSIHFVSSTLEVATRS